MTERTIPIRLFGSRRTTATIVAGLLMLGGCAPGPYSPTASLQHPGAPGRGLCVLSVVGKVYSVQKVGLTVFGNEHATAPIAD